MEAIGTVILLLCIVSYLAGLVTIVSFCNRRIKNKFILKSIIAIAIFLLSFIPVNIYLGLSYNLYKYDQNTKNLLELLIYLYFIAIIGVGLFRVVFDYYNLYKKKKNLLK